MSTTDWKRKLAAYLHDPPSKCLDIRTHGERADAAFRQAGFQDTEVGDYFKPADHAAAAADRFPFPSSRASGLQCAFDGVRNAFRHPLSGEQLRFHAEFRSVEQGMDAESGVQPILTPGSLDALRDEDERWRARFFAHWRLWPQYATEKDYRLGYLPADTRIPDHSIWTHMQVVSALDGCTNVAKVWQPAFLKFQMGPVQELIAAARSTRDLWSGSYLLSWLMAAGLKALSAEVGPDAVIYPNLRGQPLFDLHWRDELWQKVKIGERSVWESMRRDAQRTPADGGIHNSDLDLLTPNLPNVFLAVVPAERAGELGRLVEVAIREEWYKICESVWSKVEASAGLLDLLPPRLSREAAVDRFRRQTKRLLSLAWHVLPWPQTSKEARSLAMQLPSVCSTRNGETGNDSETSLVKRFDSVEDAATKAMPKEHRDGRYYVGGKDGPKTELNNVGVAWALLTAVSGWSLDAVRQTRHFEAWQSGGWQEVGVAQSKDALTGREEMLFGGSGFSENLKKLDGMQEWSKLFKHDDEVGSITLVKRVWHWSYLADVWRLQAQPMQFPMPNTRQLAEHCSTQDDDDGDPKRVEVQGCGSYFAVLALDGDSIGQWVSGDKTPCYKTQFAGYMDGTGVLAQGALEYFNRGSDSDGKGASLNNKFEDLLNTRRLVSPSYHLQFSEALSQFALRCARPIVEAYSGRLIYAGGDDVLAMLPADTALSCAEALRSAFIGQQTLGPDGAILFSRFAPGFLTGPGWKDDGGEPIPFIVPGPCADCSVGIAIAHFKSPLQDAVRAAQAAEKRAKKQLKRSAVAVTLMKRSGETIEWGCKWNKDNEGGVKAFGLMMKALEDEVISTKFPYRVVELVDGYLTDKGAAIGRMQSACGFGEVVLDVLDHEIRVAAERQRGPKYCKERVIELQGSIRHYLKSIPKPDGNEDPKLEVKVRSLIGLCQTVAFSYRTSQR